MRDDQECENRAPAAGKSGYDLPPPATVDTTVLLVMNPMKMYE